MTRVVEREVRSRLQLRAKEQRAQGAIGVFSSGSLIIRILGHKAQRHIKHNQTYFRLSRTSHNGNFSKKKIGINSTAFHLQCKTSVKSGATYGRNGNHPPVPARQRPLTQTGQCDYRARATVSDGKTTAERRAKSSELPRCVAGQTRRAAVAIVWQREKGFRAGTGTGDSTAGFVSSAPSPNDAMPHYFRNYEAVSLKLPQAARQVAPDSLADSTEGPRAPGGDQGMVARAYNELCCLACWSVDIM